MHRRIPAEIVSRRKWPRKEPKPEPEVKEDVAIDLKAAMVLKPEARVKWLSRAFRMVSEGTGSSTELYNICVSRKFASGLTERIARKLIAVIRECQDSFSEKQQRYLSSNDCPLMASLSKTMAERLDAFPELDGTTGVADEAATAAAAVTDEAAAADEALAAVEGRQARRRSPPRQSRREPVVEAGWQAVEDDASLRRQAAASADERRKVAKGKEDKRRQIEAEEEAAKKLAIEEEVTRRRKLEEEADDIFMRAFESKPQAKVEERPRPKLARRSISRSRSISSRTARRQMRKSKRS
jgi:hypothetical protein